MPQPVICFGQQPCGIFPRRFLYAKFATAKRLQKEIGGEVVFFLHDSDHDCRETVTILKNRKTGRMERLNFDFLNKLQKKYSPLYLKRVGEEWKKKTARQLPCFVGPELVDIFKTVEADNATDFCLEMYRGMGLLEGVKVVRSSDPRLREEAIEVSDYFADVPHKGEVVRARIRDGGFFLHKGGPAWEEIPCEKPEKAKISPTRDTRLLWMQSIVGCTHYVAGAGEIQYLNCSETPEITFIRRDDIERSDEAFIDYPLT